MKLVPLDTYPNEMEARLMAQRLENEGIPSVVKVLGGGYGMGVHQFMPHRVSVPEEYLSEAKSIAEGSEPD